MQEHRQQGAQLGSGSNDAEEPTYARSEFDTVGVSVPRALTFDASLSVKLSVLNPSDANTPASAEFSAPDLSRLVRRSSQFVHPCL